MKVITTILPLLLLSASSAYADRRYTTAKQAAERVKRDEAELSRRVKVLSLEDRVKLKKSFRSKDSDSDGVSDIIEGSLGSSRCDSDSDDDGIDDSMDRSERRRDDGESSSGGNSSGGSSSGGGSSSREDGVEVAARARITSFVDPIITVGGQAFTVTENTVFRGVGFSKDDLRIGLCIEIEGHAGGSEVFADKVKIEDSGC